ncbi:MAG: type II secretion system F family protein [Candidatus Yanofskybacteria bacterium]|nr:type II secretion system F family protein [Candidatus Yanofskybacteria bacterium]
MNLKSLFFRLPTKEKMLFARNLEVMIRSGMQILQSLEILKAQSKSITFRKILDQVIFDLKNGHYLADGLARYQNIFGDFFINLVRVGEASGTLSENLKYLAEELKKRDELQKKIRGAMAYPVVIFVATIGITSIMIFVIFPKILPVLTSLNVELPLVTRTFIAISQFLTKYGYLVGLALVGLAVGFWAILKIPRVRFMWHQTILATPLVKDMSRSVNIISFSRTIGLLLRAGIKIVEALEITANTLSNLVYRMEVMKVAEGVRKGDPMSKYFVASSNLFPPIFSQMVVVGENTGKLDESILFLADFYEAELDETTKSIATFIEPIMLLIMGGIVAFVALAIITPIYAITQTLGR